MGMLNLKLVYILYGKSSRLYFFVRGGGERGEVRGEVSFFVQDALHNSQNFKERLIFNN